MKEYRAEMRYFRSIHRCAWCGVKVPRWRAWVWLEYCKSCRDAMGYDFQTPPCDKMSAWEEELRRERR